MNSRSLLRVLLICVAVYYIFEALSYLPHILWQYLQDLAEPGSMGSFQLSNLMFYGSVLGMALLLLLLAPGLARWLEADRPEDGAARSAGGMTARQFLRLGCQLLGVYALVLALTPLRELFEVLFRPEIQGLGTMGRFDDFTEHPLMRERLIRSGLHLGVNLVAAGLLLTRADWIAARLDRPSVGVSAPAERA